MTSPISEAARLIGQACTAAKAAAARRNGAKGGRPRKQKTDPALLPGSGCLLPSEQINQPVFRLCGPQIKDGQ